jgi:excisionase family DNA binding protein
MSSKTPHQARSELLSLETVAAVLAVSRSKAARLVQHGELSVIRLGPRTVRVERVELDRLIARQKMKISHRMGAP